MLPIFPAAGLAIVMVPITSNISPLQGWPDVMTNMMDASKKDMGPIENTNPALCIYIVVYLVVMSFFMINIFVGFVIVTFQEKGEKDNDSELLDRNKVCVLDRKEREMG